MTDDLKSPPTLSPLLSHDSISAPALSKHAESSEAVVDFRGLIQHCLDLNIRPGARDYHHIFREFGVAPDSDSEMPDVIAASLLESLNSNDLLLVIAQKVTMLHDFSYEKGGGGFDGRMRGVPEIRKRILERLLLEISSFQNPSFSYLFDRTAGVFDSYWQNKGVLKRNHIDHLSGEDLIKAIIKINLEDFTKSQ